MRGTNMPDSVNQLKAHKFLLDKFYSQELFTKDEFQAATGQGDSTFNTYFSKQFKTLLIHVNSDNKYRVSESFRKFLSWDNFKDHVTQNKHVASDYNVSVFNNVTIFEFFMPLTNEGDLRASLDALFYKDAVLSRLKIMDKDILQRYFPIEGNGISDEYYENICRWISNKFGGYSISHVNGRFKASYIKTYEEAFTAMKNGEKYLIDETTAIVRFIFPCGNKITTKNISTDNYFESLALTGEDNTVESDAEMIRLFFFTLFVQSIVLIINGEDEIWMLESGINNRLHIWSIT
jgi:hypothetical protein